MTQAQDLSGTNSNVDSLYQQAKDLMDSYDGNTSDLRETVVPLGEQMISIAPTSPFGYYVLSRCHRYFSYYSGDKYDVDYVRDTALPYAEKAVELGPKVSLMHMNLAMCYYSMADYQKAEEIIEKAVSLSEDGENKANNLIHKGIILESKGDYPQSLNAFKQAEALPMTQAQQLYFCDNIGSLLKKMKRYDESIVYAEKRLALTPEAYWAKRNLALAYIKKAKDLIERSDFTQAEQLLFKAVDLYPSNTVYQNIAQYYSKIGDYKKALEYVNMALQEDPDDEWSLEKKRSLELKTGN